MLFPHPFSPTPLKQAQSEQIIKNLQRENALITTAWYDLNSRLQSNHVVLQRRQEMPKSWLNRQRVMVNGMYWLPSSASNCWVLTSRVATPRR